MTTIKPEDINVIKTQLKEIVKALRAIERAIKTQKSGADETQGAQRGDTAR